jgi:hypothetical protein
LNRLVFALAVFLSFTSCVSQPKRDVVEKRKTPKLFDGITIEVQPTISSPYDRSAMSEFIGDLETNDICLASRVRVVVRPPVIALRRHWTTGDIRLFERRFRRLWDNNKHDRHLIIHISLLPGIYMTPKMNNVIGLKYGRNQSIALLRGAFGRNLLFHELGHVIGLVDRCEREGDPVNPDRPNHCNTSQCTMFWTVHAREAPRLDPLCRRDIQALIDKGQPNGHVNRLNQFSSTTPICSPRQIGRQTTDPE